MIIGLLVGVGIGLGYLLTGIGLFRLFRNTLKIKKDEVPPAVAWFTLAWPIIGLGMGVWGACKTAMYLATTEGPSFLHKPVSDSERIKELEKEMDMHAEKATSVHVYSPRTQYRIDDNGYWVKDGYSVKDQSDYH